MTAPQEEQQQPTTATAEATAQTDAMTYIARRPLLFGTVKVQPGQTVPIQEGRNYALLLKRGDIVHAGPLAVPLAEAMAQAPRPATVNPEAAHRITVGRGPAVFVSEDGAGSKVMVLGFRAATAQDAEEGGTALGELLAEVTFDDDAPEEGPALVSASALLPEEPTGRLLADIEAFFEGQATDSASATATAGGAAAVELEKVKGELTQARQSNEDLQGKVTQLTEDLAAARVSPGTGTGEGEEDPDLADLRERLSFVTAERDFALLCIKAATAEGEALPDNVPSRAALLKSHIKTLPGLLMLAQPPQGVSSLAALDGIAEKAARKIIAWLTTAGYLKPEPQQGQEGGAQGEQTTPES